ncbi:MAG TPA: hypothetical protein VLA12_00360 [Planctomycetaceae bacterium]|nr:hypothetical protein [Planctomycetaceae bacterium]
MGWFDSDTPRQFLGPRQSGPSAHGKSRDRSAHRCRITCASRSIVRLQRSELQGRLMGGESSDCDRKVSFVLVT